MYFVFAIKIRHMPVSRGNAKVTRKKGTKLFSYDNDHYNTMKFHLIEEDDSDPLTRKIDRLRLLWGMFKEYAKKIHNIKEYPRTKADSNFDFPQTA